MKAGTFIKLPDGRVGTVVYNGLDGYGIKWGKIELTEEDLSVIMSGDGNIVQFGKEFDFNPDAMLREKYPSAEIECVGKDFEIIN